MRWKIRARGQACHSSTPKLGKNAIYTMARVISALEEHADELATRVPDPVLGTPSLSVVRIDGGVSANVVPDWCEIDIDRRVVPGETPSHAPAQAKAHVQSRLGDIMNDVEFLPPWVNMPPWFQVEPTAFCLS